MHCHIRAYRANRVQTVVILIHKVYVYCCSGPQGVCGDNT